jgi:predicted glycosyltransferase
MCRFTTRVSSPVRLTRAVAQHGARSEIIVSTGGGAVGLALLRAAIDARRALAVGPAPWRLLVGTNASDDELAVVAPTRAPA